MTTRTTFPILARTAMLTVATMAAVPAVHAQLAPPSAVPYSSQMDADMLTVLETYVPIAGTPIYQLKPVDARQQFSAQDAAKAVARVTGKQLAPDAVASIVDMKIPTVGGALIPIRVYTPAGKGPFPVVVYFHGGGFVIATIDTYDGSARALANGAGALVISVEYRKAPEFPFPAALEDAVAAYYWAMGNAGSLNGNPAKIAVAGESAGGNLAANIAILSHELGVQQPVRQVLIYPLVDSSTAYSSDLVYADAVPLGLAGLKYFGAEYVPSGVDPENSLVSPIHANLAGLAPATVISAQIDPLQSQGKAYAEKLKAAGVKVDYTLYTGVTHEFFGMGAVVAKAKAAEAQAAMDLKSSF